MVENIIKTQIFIEADDDTYIYGNRFYDAYIDGNKDNIEPYYTTDNDKIIKYFPSRHLFVVYENNSIIEIIFTSTCWSDDYEKYDIKDNKPISLYESYHSGCRILKIKYENNISSEVIFEGRNFGSYSVGDEAPNFDDLIKELNL